MKGRWDIGLSATPATLVRKNMGNLYLAARMLFSFYKDDRGWRVKTEGYDYALAESPNLNTSLYSWHWHPMTRPDPHMHVGGSMVHLPTGRVL